MLLSYSTLLPVLMAYAQLAKAEDYEIVGSFIFGRHNDREAKPATVLTPIGATNQYITGQFYRERYFGINSDGERNDTSSTLIKGLNDEGLFVDGQLYAEAISSNVILFSHYAFLQGLYPPTNLVKADYVDEMMAELANGTVVENPLDGYQYVKSNIQENATDAYIHIKGDVNCPSLTSATKKTMKSELWSTYSNESAEFLQSLYEYDFIKETFSESELTFTNSMNIYDELNVNTIHNATVAKEISEDVVRQVKVWSDLYQWTLSDKTINTNLTIGAQSLLGNMVTRLNTTKVKGTPFLTYYTGSFNTMFQLASILDLDQQDERFKTMPDYGCTYVFELLSDSNEDIFVRFSFQNGTSELGQEPTSYALFNSTDEIMPWDDFVTNAKNAGISGVSTWCDACGYNDGSDTAMLDMCVPYSNLYESAKQLEAEGVNLSSIDIDSDDQDSGSNLTLADAGGIGAGVTIGVFLILGAAFFLFKKVRSRKQTSPVLPIAKEDADHTHSESSTVKSTA